MPLQEFTFDASLIKNLQSCLGVPETGVYDSITKSAVRNFNLTLGNGSNSDLNLDTYTKIMNRYGSSVESSLYNEIDDFDCTTDLCEGDFEIQEHMLDSDEYVVTYGEKREKDYIFLHHTAGGNNPYSTIDYWNADNRGRIGTHFVIGGQKIDNGDSEYDGIVLKCIPDEYFAFHLGGKTKHGIDSYMHQHSIGIEICNFGWLQEKNGAFYTYVGTRADDDQIVDLGYDFRGYRYWHKYSNAQINSTYFLLKHLSKRFDIDLEIGLKEWILNDKDAFGYKTDAVSGKVKGLLSHTNVRKDKSDIFPQKEMLEMLKSL